MNKLKPINKLKHINKSKTKNKLKTKNKPAYYTFDSIGKLVKHDVDKNKTLKTIIERHGTRGSSVSSSYVILDKQFKLIEDYNQNIQDTGDILIVKKLFQIEIDTKDINKINNFFKLGV